MKRLGLRLHADEEHWIPLSDLMTGLMFLFLLISLAYMVATEVQQAKPKDALAAYAQTRAQLYHDLYREFYADLPGWGAILDSKTLSIRFYARNVLFAPGSADLQPRFKIILDDFFPRYVRILSSPKYRDIVSELRIEGYTGSFWRAGATPEESYLGNMALSQERTRAVLGYVLALPPVASHETWLTQVLTANGLSSSHLIRQSDGTEDPNASQRVEFRVRTNADEQVRKLVAMSTTAPRDAVTKPLLPTIFEPMPPYPDWAARLIGQPLRKYFPKKTSKCLGYLDGPVAHYVGSRTGVEIVGWGYDTTAKTPVSRVIFANNNDLIVGAAEGGFQRPDVPARLPQIASIATGWQGYANVTPRPVAAWGIMSAPGTLCRLEPAGPASGETM